MNTFTKILCRTVGTAGMGLAAYDAIKVGGQTSRNRATEAQGTRLYIKGNPISGLLAVSFSCTLIAYPTD